jgi:hypothetical protein
MNHYYVLYEKIPHDGANWLTVVSGLNTMRSTPQKLRCPDVEQNCCPGHGLQSSLEPTFVAKRAKQRILSTVSFLEETATTNDKLPS